VQKQTVLKVEESKINWFCCAEAKSDYYYS